MAYRDLGPPPKLQNVDPVLERWLYQLWRQVSGLDNYSSAAISTTAISTQTLSTSTAYAQLVSTAALTTGTLWAGDTAKVSTLVSSQTLSTGIVYATNTSTGSVSTTSVYASGNVSGATVSSGPAYPSFISTKNISANTLYGYISSGATPYFTFSHGVGSQLQMRNAGGSDELVQFGVGNSTGINSMYVGFGGLTVGGVIVTDINSVTVYTSSYSAATGKFTWDGFSTKAVTSGVVSVGTNLSSATVSTGSVYAATQVSTALALVGTNLSSATISTQHVYASTITLNVPIQASSVQMLKIGSPTYSTVEDMQTIIHSCGWISGGVISADANGIDVTAGEGVIRDANARTGLIYWVTWSAVADQTGPASGSTKYVGVEYNAGTPQIIIKDTYSWNFYDEFPLGSVTYDGNDWHVQNTPFEIGDHAGLMVRQMTETMTWARDNFNGGLVIGDVGANNDLTLTAGALWYGLTRKTFSAVDTSAAGTFDAYYHVGGTWTTSTLSAWPATQYDDGTDLVTMTNNRYANLWFYLDVSKDRLNMLYGTNEYVTIAQAENESAPGTVPPTIEEHGRLLGRFIFQESNTSADEVNSVWDTTFSIAGVTDHGSLAGLADDDHTQYLLASGARAATFLSTGGLDATGSVSSATVSTASVYAATQVSTAQALVGTNLSSATISTGLLYALRGSSGFSTAINARTAAVFENSNAAGATISILSPSTGYSGIFFGDEGSEVPGQIKYWHTSNVLALYVGGADRLTLTNSVGKFDNNLSSVTISTGTIYGALSTASISTSSISTAALTTGTLWAGSVASVSTRLSWQTVSTGTVYGGIDIDRNNAAKIGATSTDTAIKLLIRGTSTGLRIGTDVSSALIDAVDNTGTGSYQNLAITARQSTAIQIVGSGVVGYFDLNGLNVATRVSTASISTASVYAATQVSTTASYTNTLLAGTNVQVSSGTGRVVFNTDAGGSIEFGRTDTSSTPYFDWHSGTVLTDYDVRILASGGNGSSGGGTLRIYADNVSTSKLILQTNLSSATVSTASVYAPTSVSTAAISTGSLAATGLVSSANISTGSVYAPTRVSTAAISTGSLIATGLVSSATISTASIRATANISSATMSTASLYAPTQVSTAKALVGTNLSSATISTGTVYYSTLSPSITVGGAWKHTFDDEDLYISTGYNYIVSEALTFTGTGTLTAVGDGRLHVIGGSA